MDTRIGSKPRYSLEYNAFNFFPLLSLTGIVGANKTFTIYPYTMPPYKFNQTVFLTKKKKKNCMDDHSKYFNLKKRREFVVLIIRVKS